MTAPFTSRRDVAEDRLVVERALSALLPPATTHPARLHEALHYALFAGGKRLRPLLVLAACRACEGEDRQAMAAAGREEGDSECMLLSILSAQHDFPGTSFVLQDRLDVAEVPCIDLRAQCSGFLYGLSFADSLVRTGKYERVLVVAAHPDGGNLVYDSARPDPEFEDVENAWTHGPGS